jgi:hypothetical protein
MNQQRKAQLAKSLTLTFHLSLARTNLALHIARDQAINDVERKLANGKHVFNKTHNVLEFPGLLGSGSSQAHRSRSSCSDHRF